MRAVTLRLWPGDDERSCCSPGALQRAADTARRLGLDFEEIDRGAAFEDRVVAPFVSAYLAGETPNPCVECNPFRLADLDALARERGCATLATGHYARIERRGDEVFVARAADGAKDQSYMLWRVAPDTLARLRLPLGELTKTEVRRLASAAGLPVAEQPESQEVCFATSSYRRFLAARGAAPRAGLLVTRDGRVLGRHSGHWRYTVGQRRGLGLAADEPLYVLERRAADNVVVVGRRAELSVSAVEVRDLVDRDLGDGAGLEVQLRYRSGAIGVQRLRRRDGDRAVVELVHPFEGLAPGQSAVFYRRDAVVGGGVIAGPA